MMAPIKMSERTIMRKRPCKYGCGTEIYLQYIPVTPTLRWISFEASDGKLHSYPNRPLEPKTQQLIQRAIDKTKPTSTVNSIYIDINNIEVLHRMDAIIEDLEFIRQYLANDLAKILPSYE